MFDKNIRSTKLFIGRKKYFVDLTYSALTYIINITRSVINFVESDI